MMSAAQWGGGTNVIAQPFTLSFSDDDDDDDGDDQLKIGPKTVVFR